MSFIIFDQGIIHTLSTYEKAIERANRIIATNMAAGIHSPVDIYTKQYTVTGSLQTEVSKTE